MVGGCYSSILIPSSSVFSRTLSPSYYPFPLSLLLWIIQNWLYTFFLQRMVCHSIFSSLTFPAFLSNIATQRRVMWEISVCYLPSPHLPPPYSSSFPLYPLLPSLSPPYSPPPPPFITFLSLLLHFPIFSLPPPSHLLFHSLTFPTSYFLSPASSYLPSPGLPSPSPSPSLILPTCSWSTFFHQLQYFFPSLYLLLPPLSFLFVSSIPHLLLPLLLLPSPASFPYCSSYISYFFQLFYHLIILLFHFKSFVIRYPSASW